MEVTYKVILKGLVQGVGFRHFAYEKAHALGLKGWVKNLHTGEVEVIVHGSQDTVNSFIFCELKRGPSGARVNDMSVDEYNTNADFPQFLVTH